jgi:putative transcriptional regulator
MARKRARLIDWRISGLSLILLCSLSVPGVARRAVAQSGHLTGQLLVAAPDMRDPRFVETVVYVVEHNADGALGLVINRPLAKGPSADLLKGLGLESSKAAGEIVIHYGGPVNERSGFVLHSDDFLLENSTHVADGIAMTADAKLIEAISQGKGPRQFLFMLGYAGWAPDQLEAEMKGGFWFAIPGDNALIFGTDADKKWQQALDRKKIPL